MAGDAQGGEGTGRLRPHGRAPRVAARHKGGALKIGLAQLRDPPGAACRPCGRRRPNNSLALRARYPNWSNPKVQDPSMFGSKFLFAWQVCLSSKSVRGVCVCIYSLYYKGVRKSKFLTKFAPYVAIIMCHFRLGLDSTFKREEERRGEVLSRRVGGTRGGRAAGSRRPVQDPTLRPG